MCTHGAQSIIITDAYCNIAQRAQQSLSISAADIQTKHRLLHSSAGSQQKTTTNESRAMAATVVVVVAAAAAAPHFAPFTAYEMSMRPTIPYSDGWAGVIALLRTQSPGSSSHSPHISQFLCKCHEQVS